MVLSSAAGARNRRITFQRAQITKDAMNADVETWGDQAQRWACASFGTGQERRDAAQQSGSAPATFRVLSDSFTRTLTLQDRIRFMDADWDITSIVPAGDEKLNAAIDITAMRGEPSVRIPAPTNDLTGAIVAAGVLTGALQRGVLLTGGVQASGSFAGALRTSVDLAGAVQGAAMLTGALTAAPAGAVALTGGVAGTGVVAGQMRVTMLLSGTVLGGGGLSGALVAEARLSGGVAGSGAVAGTMLAEARLFGAVAGGGVVAGVMRTEVRLSGGVAGTGALAGALTVTAGPAYDSDAQAFFTAAGVTDNTEKAQINSFIVGAKADGFWAKMDRLAVLAASSPAVALCDVRTPAKAFSAVNSPLFTANRGYTGDGSAAFIDFNERFDAAGNQFALSSATLGAWCNAEGASTGRRGHIGQALSATRMNIRAGRGSTNDTYQANDNSIETVTAQATRLGHRTIVRAGANDKRVLFNGAITATFTSASTALATANGNALRASTNAADYASDTIAAVYSGGAMTDADVANLHARLNTLLSARGAA